jgi:hypothetical protein
MTLTMSTYNYVFVLNTLLIVLDSVPLYRMKNKLFYYYYYCYNKKKHDEKSMNECVIRQCTVLVYNLQEVCVLYVLLV